jgi:hypothetical protein
MALGIGAERRTFPGKVIGDDSLKIFKILRSRRLLIPFGSQFKGTNLRNTMRKIHSQKLIPRKMGLALAGICFAIPSSWAAQDTVIGREVALPQHLEDGDEYAVPLADLIGHGRDMLTANWTIQEGGGRPLTKGTGAPLADPDDPLEFPRNFNRVSAPDANSCAGCHNSPFGVPGGAGDIVANVFVLGQRFDFATLSADDDIPTKSNVDEYGNRVNLQTIAN